jgi:hypothetical protein
VLNAGASSDTVTGGAGADDFEPRSTTGFDVVILTTDIAGDITTHRAAVAIGSTDSNYAVGDVRMFVLDNDTASNADARVSAADLTLLATLHGASSLATADIEFGS